MIIIILTITVIIKWTTTLLIIIMIKIDKWESYSYNIQTEVANSCKTCFGCSWLMSRVAGTLVLFINQLK